MRGLGFKTTAFCLILLANSIFGGSVAGASGPFNCQPGFYQVISGHLKILNPLTGAYSDIGVAGDTYNAIGYNPSDDYIYGWGTSGAINGQLIKVDSAGTVTALGNVGITGSNFVSGDFDNNNNIYFRKNSTTLVRINVATTPLSHTELTLTGSSFEGVDMGWIGGVMYSVNNSTLYRVDLATLQVTSAVITDLGSPSGKEFPATGSQAYGAVFSNRDNELYASNNIGRIFQISDFTSGSPTATWIVDSTQTSNNDGAACKLAVSPFDLPSVVNDSYSTTTGTTLTVPRASGVFDNDNANSPTIVSNTNPSSGVLTLNPDGSFTFQPSSGFEGSVTFTYTAQDQWGRGAGTATVTINVTAAPGSSVTTLPETPATTVVPTTTNAPVLPDTGGDTNGWLVGALTLLIGGLLLVRRRVV